MLSPSDVDLIRRDRALPGLATLLDPDAFAAALRAGFPLVDPSTIHIGYVRYKPGTSCLVGYLVDLDGGAVHVHAKAHRLDAQDKLAKERHPAVAGPLGAGHVVLEDQAIAISVFPNDRELKALARLSEKRAQRHLLREIVDHRRNIWKGTMRSLRYKPERRFVAQVLDGAGIPVAVVKVCTDSHYPGVQHNARAFASRHLLRVSPCLGNSDRHRIVILEWRPGALLRDALSDPSSGLEAVAKAGFALAELHAQRPGGLRHTSAADEAGAITALAEWLGFLCPHLADRVKDLARRLGARLVDDSSPVCSIHGDFYPDQVLLTADGVALLDLDEAALGDPALDLGRFVGHLQRDALCGTLPPRVVEPVAMALVDGYRQATEPPDPSRIALYAAIG